MQLRVSTTAVAEHRHELSHSHREGSAAAVPHAAHRHRPHTTQMMESVAAAAPEEAAASFSAPGDVFGSAAWCSAAAEKGGVVITDAECGGGRGWGGGRGRAFTALLSDWLELDLSLPPGAAAAPLKGVST